MARKSAGWHSENIKAAIRVKFGSLRAFAEAIESSPQSVSGAISDPTKSSRIERKIAENLGKTPFELWPDRWTPNGERRSRADFCRQSSLNKEAI